MGNKQLLLEKEGECLYNQQHKIRHNHKGFSFTNEKVSKANFEYIAVIGRGGFGKVWKVYDKKYKRLFAMKEMSKLKILDKQSDISVKSERDLLSKLYHPFIVNMHYAFQDKDSLYLVMDLLTGGDLRYHLCKREKFSEEQTKFIITCIILSLEYIHSNNIMHRDLKPENLVFNDKGYIKLTDFGIAKPYNPDQDNSMETSGTPGYMAPEVLCALKHSMVVDFYALGIIAFELMLGYRPHNGSRKDVKEQIMAKQTIIHKYKIPFGYSTQCADFINLLIQRKPKKRLGMGGTDEIKNHPWLKYFNWKDLYLGKIIAPFIPKEQDNYDQEFCNMVERIGFYTRERYNKIMKNDNYDIIFDNYEYFDIKREPSVINEENNYQLDLGLINGEEMIKSRNKKNKIFAKKNYITFSNPHAIYKVLEEKENKAFTSENQNENLRKNVKHGRNKSDIVYKGKLFKWGTADIIKKQENLLTGSKIQENDKQNNVINNKNNDNNNELPENENKGKVRNLVISGNNANYRIRVNKLKK